MSETNNNQPATKGDLAILKTDMENLARKMDQKFAQTDKSLASLGVEVSKNSLRMDTLENNIMTALRSFKSDLLSSYEASVMKGEMYSQKAVTHGDILSGHEEKLLNHETRLASLESK